MTYREIRAIITEPKRAKANNVMQSFTRGRIGIMWSDKTDAIILDSKYVDEASQRRWCIDSGGYPIVNIGGNMIRLHDYVMAQEYDEKPSGHYVDHVNRDKLDNRITNLRFVCPQASSHNMPMRSDNTSGYIGVSETKSGKYRAYITVNKRRIDLGTYANASSAYEARRAAERLLHVTSNPITIDEKCNIAFLCELEKDQ